MKKLLFLFLVPFLMGAANPVYDSADQIATNTSSFSKNLSSSDTTVQKALNTIDQMSGGSGSSQWSGTNPIYYNTGNVGIGTATPTHKLDIDGTVYVRNKLDVLGNIELYNDESAQVFDYFGNPDTHAGMDLFSVGSAVTGSIDSWYSPAGEQKFSYWQSTTGDTTFIQGLSAKAGGTATDIYASTDDFASATNSGSKATMRFQVNVLNPVTKGVIGMDNAGRFVGGESSRWRFQSLALDSAPSIGYEMDTYNTLATAGAKHTVWENNTNIIAALGTDGSLYANGNVGVGTSVPQAKLDVEGNVYVNGNVSIGSVTPAATLHIPSPTAFVHIGTQTPNITAGLLTLKGDTINGQRTALSFDITNSNVPNAVYAAQFTARMTANAGGGSIYGIRTNTSWEGSGGSGYAVFGGFFNAGSRSGRAGTLSNLIGAYGTASINSGMLIDQMGGFEAAFDVNDSPASISNGFGLKIDDMNMNSSGGSATISQYSGIDVGNSNWDAADGQAIRIRTQDAWGNNTALNGNIIFEGGDWNNGHLQFVTAHQWATGGVLRFKSSDPSSATDYELQIASTGVSVKGNLGIGSTNPRSKLDVIGGSYISGNVGVGSSNPRGKLDVNGTVYGDATNMTGVLHSYTETDPKVGSLTSGKYAKWGTTSLIDSMIYDNGTNVGIGSTDPIQYLDVEGSVYVNGNIGVGTAYPASKLEVDAGKINVRNSLIKTVLGGGNSPTAGTCGTSPTITANSSNFAGQITVGGGTVTACTVNFGASPAFTTAPFCFLQPGGATAGNWRITAISTSAFTFTTNVSVAGNTYNWICIDN